MPQLDPAVFVPQLFWLAATFVLLYLLMQFVAVPQVGRVLEQRRRRLDSDLGRAGELRGEAEAVLAAYEKTVAAARAEAQARLRETAERMAAEAAERQRRLAASLAEQIGAAERRIAASKSEALSQVRDLAADVGRVIVEKLTGAAPEAGRLAAAVEGALAGRNG
jgi:F-type H+-transporting ATPase subunit b